MIAANPSNPLYIQEAAPAARISSRGQPPVTLTTLLPTERKISAAFILQIFIKTKGSQEKPSKVRSF